MCIEMLPSQRQTILKIFEVAAQVSLLCRATADWLVVLLLVLS